MTDEDIMREIELLPEPDLMEPGKITDPVGSSTYYSARTVARLLLEQREAIEELRLERKFENRR
jgi:hypothetical protein